MWRQGCLVRISATRSSSSASMLMVTCASMRQGAPVVDRTHSEPGLELPPALFDAHELLVSERQVFRRERVVVGGDHPLTIVVLFAPHSLPIHYKAVGALSQITPYTLACQQLAHPLGVTFGRWAHAGKLLLQLLYKLVAVSRLARRFFRVVA